nr:hypothetical protein [Micromonospora sp. CP22]
MKYGTRPSAHRIGLSTKSCRRLPAAAGGDELDRHGAEVGRNPAILLVRFRQRVQHGEIRLDPPLRGEGEIHLAEDAETVGFGGGLQQVRQLDLAVAVRADLGGRHDQPPVDALVSRIGQLRQREVAVGELGRPHAVEVDEWVEAHRHRHGVTPPRPVNVSPA